MPRGNGFNWGAWQVVPRREGVQLGEIELFGAPIAAPGALKEKEKRMENGPELWSLLLNNVREIYECDACVAGGAVRDYFLDVQPKDIDVFVDINFPEVVSDSMAELNWGDGFQTGRDYQENDSAIKGVWEFYHERSNLIINLIARPIPTDTYVLDLLKTFDFNICKAAYYLDSERGPELYESPEAREDRELKQFTFVGDSPDKSRKRFERFTARTGQKFKLVGIDPPGEKTKKESVTNPCSEYISYIGLYD